MMPEIYICTEDTHRAVPHRGFLLKTKANTMTLLELIAENRDIEVQNEQFKSRHIKCTNKSMGSLGTAPD